MKPKLAYTAGHHKHGGWFHNRPECIIAWHLQGNDPIEPDDLGSFESEIHAFEDKWLCESCEQRLITRNPRVNKERK
jgi:hypothetical protein